MNEGAYLWLLYAAYGTVSVTLTIWLARTLFRNGEVFLEEVFADRPKLARSVNRLLVIGFYLFNLGYACVLLPGGYAETVVDAVEAFSSKMGALLFSLALMHFMNLFVFHRIRRRAQQRHAPPPVPPQGRVDLQGVGAWADTGSAAPVGT